MTPLAQRLIRQMNMPDDGKGKEEIWRGRSDALGDYLWGIHCFEVSLVLPLAYQIAEVAAEQGGALDGKLFCPAPKTWIEWIHPDLGRVALLIEEGRHEAVTVTAFWGTSLRLLGCISTETSGLIIDRGYQPQGAILPERWTEIDDLDRKLLNIAQIFLYIINSPKIIGRRQHMPHRGLERELVSAGRSGKRFPLEAWSEIILEARPTYFDESGVEHEAHLTGRKCLHFCRAHVRIRNGKMEIVGSHWRGDAALGIKKSRYKVAPPSDRPRLARTA